MQKPDPYLNQEKQSRFLPSVEQYEAAHQGSHGGTQKGK
jgi:hypothetical protein